MDGGAMLVPLYGPPIFKQAEPGALAALEFAPPPLQLADAPAADAPAAARRGEPIADADYWLDYFRNVPRFFTAPLRFDAGDWIKTGAFAAAVGGAYLADERLNKFFHGHRNRATDDLAAIGYRLGDSKSIVAGSALGYALGYGLGDDRLRETSLLVLQSWVLAAGASEGVKRLIGRERPSSNDIHDDFDFLGGKDKSLPSGHAVNAFAAAAVIAEQYDDTPWVAPAAYGLAGLVAWSRLNDNAHWASDVVLGAGLGYAAGKLVAHFSPFREQAGMTAAPLPVSGGGGVQLGFRF